MQSPLIRDFALAQASIEHALYFLELGATSQAAAYFQFAAGKLGGIAGQLLEGDRSDLAAPSYQLGTPDDALES